MLTVVVGSDAQVAVLEILKLVEESMSRFGLAGRLEIDGHHLVLHGHGLPAAIELGPLIEQWPGLSPDARLRRCHEIVRQLQQQRHGLVSARPPPRKVTTVNTALLLGLTVAGMACFAFWYVLRSLNTLTDVDKPRPRNAPVARASAPSAAQPQSATTAYEVERRARALRVCRSTQSRIMRGATVGPTDVEGWVIDLMLLSPGTNDWLTAGKLDEFLTQLPDESWRITWKTAPELSAPEGVGTEVAVAPLVLDHESSAPGEPERHTGLTFTLHGRYVVPYFHEEQRIQYVRFAHAVSQALGAQFGALYARCDGEHSHHLGGWFRGPTPGTAAATLIFAMSAHADVPLLQAELLTPEPEGDFDAGHCWRALSSRSAELDRGRLIRLLGTQGGMVTGRANGGPTSITFPFKDSNRAERSSLLIAQELKLASVL
jgi:serine/threonine-protein kinase